MRWWRIFPTSLPLCDNSSNTIIAIVGALLNSLYIVLLSNFTFELVAIGRRLLVYNTKRLQEQTHLYYQDIVIIYFCLLLSDESSFVFPFSFIECADCRMRMSTSSFVILLSCFSSIGLNRSKDSQVGFQLCFHMNLKRLCTFTNHSQMCEFIWSSGTSTAQQQKYILEQRYP